MGMSADERCARVHLLQLGVRLSSVMRLRTATGMLGAQLQGSTTEFRLWAPACERVTLRMEDGRTFPMTREESGVFSAAAPVRAGERYFYTPEGASNPHGLSVPDPVSRLLPEGVHGPTEIIDLEAFRWTDENWRGLPFSDYVIYELHVGTFTPQGTFEAVVEKFDHLKQLGVTVIELMPVNAFPGNHNWGYDGVAPYAVQKSYGGPDGLKRLVDAAHHAGFAVILDVVYNHLGNEGNYLRLFGPYFTSRHSTPWGDAINFDDDGSEHVRRYFIENALYWIREYHLDGFRMDAVHEIQDESAVHILAEIRDEVKQLGADLGREVVVIVEDDTNNSAFVRPRSEGGFGVDAIWSDDFHHAVHTSLTGESSGYYQDYGKREQIVRALNEGFAFQGEPFAFWKGRPRGTSSKGMPLSAHVICIQNHDQVGNRAFGERLSHLVSRGAAKLAAALMLLAPHTPLLFMGEEYAESAPFQFFTDYQDPALQVAVSEGRKKEFGADFDWTDFPDPQDRQTFERSRLHWEEATADNDMLRWYQQLIALRRRYVLPNARTCSAELRRGAIVMEVPAETPQLIVVAEFPGSGRFESPACWVEALSNDENDYRVAVYVREEAGECNPSEIVD